jgi:hypothetical protein
MRRPKIFAYLVIFLIFISVLWISRKIFFKYVFDKLIVKTEKRFDLDIQVKEANLKGLSTVYLTKLKVNTKEGKNIANSDSISLNIKLLPLIFGKVRISCLSVYNTHVNLNIEILRNLKNKNNTQISIDSTDKKIAETNYAGFINDLTEKFYNFLPREIIIRNTSLSYSHDSINASVTLENFIYQKGQFVGDIIFADKTLENYCLVTGTINPSNYSLNCKFNKSNHVSTKLPYIGPRWKAAFGFDTLTLSLNYFKVNDHQSTLVGKASVDKMLAFNKQMGPDTIITNYGFFQFHWNISKNAIELDSSSNIQLNRFSFSPYFRFQKDTSNRITFAFIRKEFEANDLFSSFPQGLFSNFTGIETKGRLAYQMHVSIDLNHPDSVSFGSHLENLGFSIKKYGNTDFRLMNNTFIHDVYENDRLMTSFAVGPENPDFMPLDQISPYLKSSILTSEDGDFYYHRGFNEKAFRESISKNLKEKRFARGGSTITMQLVKNVFLSRKKIISRKVEEALIVWIIENLRLTNKDRMFEVYLNIIEWGPGIYGIKAASKFYFNKQPKDLNLTESLYLTSLIPRPKGFKYTFDNNGRIRDYMKSYYQFLSGIMVRRNLITPEDTINLRPITKLTGEAKNFLFKPDSTSYEDSLYFLKPIDLIPQNIIQ